MNLDIWLAATGPVEAARARRTGYWTRTAAQVVAALALAACSTPRLEVRPQISASGQPAYELKGSSLQVLQTEVRRLCPSGADVLLQAQTHQRNESEPGFVKRWTTEILSPAPSEAHMQVICKG